MADRTLRARIVVDTDGVNKAVDGVSSKMGKLGGMLGGLGGMLAGGLATAGVGALFGSMISGASDLEETLNKSRVIFGQNASAMEQWASGAVKTFGLTKQQALEAASSFGNMFQQLGFSGQAATDMSKNVVQLSTDLGSFNNLPTAEVSDMMSAAFRGEYDSLQRLIPNINAARVESEAMAMTGKTTAKELTAQEKATATLAIVTKDGAAAQGDFSETSGGFANQQKILNAQIQESAAQIGSALLPIMAQLMNFISGTLVPGIMSVVKWFQENIQVIGIVAAVIGTVLIPILIAWGVQSTIAAAKSVAAWISTQASAIAAGVTHTGAFLSMIGGWIATAARATISAAIVVAGWIALAVSAAVNAAIVVGAWVLMGIQSLLNAARMAAAWLIAMGPIGWIIAVIIALVALIIANWDTIVAWTKQTWEAFMSIIQGAIDWVIRVWDEFYRMWIQPIVGFIEQAIRGMAITFDIAGKAIGLMWQALGDAIGWVWNNLIKIHFDAIRVGIDTLKGWFDAGVKGIGDIWNKLKELAAGPVRFIINTVWNDGLRVAWNTISKLWGAAELPRVSMGFASGGAVKGPGTATSDSILAMLSTGEHVWTANEVKKAGGHGAVTTLRERIASYAGGGPVGGKAIYQQLATLAAQMVPGTRMSSGYRPGDPGFHGAGKAADLVGNLGAINQAIAREYPNASELIYTPGVNIKNGRQITYSPAIRADHYDHVHWAMNELVKGAGVGGVGAGAGGFDPFAQIKTLLDPVFKTVGEAVGKFGNNPLVQGLVSMGKGVIDNLIKVATDFVSRTFGSVTTGATSNEAPGIVKIISDVARSRFGNYARQAAIIGVATGIVESNLRNIPGGDRDSVGVFQQRPSQGWGSIAQIMNVTYAAGKFFERFPNNWMTMDRGRLAQSIQRSAFPARYTPQMGRAEGLVNQYGGFLLGGMVPGNGLAELHRGEYVLNARLVDAIKRGNGSAVGNTYNLTVVNAANGEIDLREQFRRMELLGT